MKKAVTSFAIMLYLASCFSAWSGFRSGPAAEDDRPAVTLVGAGGFVSLVSIACATTVESLRTVAELADLVPGKPQVPPRTPPVPAHERDVEALVSPFSTLSAPLRAFHSLSEDGHISAMHPAPRVSPGTGVFALLVFLLGVFWHLRRLRFFLLKSPRSDTNGILFFLMAACPDRRLYPVRVFSFL